MDLSAYSIAELVGLYSDTIKELKARGVLRTKNVIGELGEYLVVDYYYNNPNLPNLSIVPVGTKNINAFSQDGERYSIKSTTGNVTGVFYGLEPPESSSEDKPSFEYVIICKLDDDCALEGIYQLDWKSFVKHKKWHSRMKAWNLTITKALKEDAVIIFEKSLASENKEDKTEEKASSNLSTTESEYATPVKAPVVWNKTEKVNHSEVREAVARRLSKRFGSKFEKLSQSRYVSEDKEHALFILSASYSQKNGEYWYSINDENIPWLELFPKCHIAFALGSPDNVLLFSISELKSLLEGCLRTQEDEQIGKKAHYHLSFAFENEKQIYFKRKRPEREFEDVTGSLV